MKACTACWSYNCSDEVVECGYCSEAIHPDNEIKLCGSCDSCIHEHSLRYDLGGDRPYCMHCTDKGYVCHCCLENMHPRDALNFPKGRGPVHFVPNDKYTDMYWFCFKCTSELLAAHFSYHGSNITKEMTA